ncbi:MAG TPA: sugar O-acetyltransferase [Candidatus Ruminococcus gallistercoris]|nr:sugar O-acetyltransferase [Candidatus Ruminococcus gallistercoris]
MDLQAFLDHMNSGKTIKGGSEAHLCMCALSQEALQRTAELNGAYHTPEEVRRIFSALTGRPVDDTFTLFPPFHTDCGKNIAVGKNVFINSGCKFQDQGGIVIGDGALIGHNVVLATLNHSLAVRDRQDLIPGPIRIGKNAWIGSNVTILPGVTVGDGAVVAAGAVVTKDVPAYTVAGGVPARVLRPLTEEEKGQ